MELFSIRIQRTFQLVSTLYMYGIDRNIPIIDTLRDRVKIARKESGIFEVANRS